MRGVPLVLFIALASCKSDDPDLDRDGSPGSEDCDDANPRVAPGRHEECDELDNDCDGEIDEGVQLELHADSDGDSYGAIETLLTCSGDGFVTDGSDCDDDDSAVHPGVKKDLCDGRDDDCDGEDGQPVSWYADADGDGYGSAATETRACAAPADFVADATDCDDGDSAVHPGAVEDCDNTIDDDCDGLVADELDHDGDGGYSDACPGGIDCDDTDSEVHAGAKETCGDGIDNDCSGADLACEPNFSGRYDLADATVVTGESSSEADAGRVMQAGDVTGDGIDDAFTGTLWAHGGNGGGWVVPGPVSGAVALADVGFDLAGTDATGGAGRSIGLGDANADGIDDLAFGCPYNLAPGQYIVYGPITADMEIADSSDAAIVSSGAGTLFSHGSDLGDVDGDGAADSIIGDYGSGDHAHLFQAGALWVTLGPLTGELDVSAGADAHILGEHDHAWAGRFVHVDGDIDGDGLDDIVLNAIGDETAGPSAGAVHVVYGPADISSLDDAAILVGPAPNSFAGQEFTSGDYDGDGYGEVAVLAYVSQFATVHVAKGPLADMTDLETAEAVIEADTIDSELGWGLASGDLDGDGNTDLLIGDPAYDSFRGVAYLVADPPSGTWAIGDVVLATFEGDTADSHAGQAMAVGDMNGDGDDDLAIGAPGLMGSGGVYVQYAVP
jgi:hypothetical protein